MKSVKLLLRFPKDITTRPISYHLVKDYDLVFNIFKAQIDYDEKGELAIEVTGLEKNIESGIDFLKNEGVEVTLLSKTIALNEDLCVNCGLCTSVCPTQALTMSDEDKLVFDSEKCVACQMCVTTCPMRAMSVNYFDQ
jgi:ferredoxin